MTDNIQKLTSAEAQQKADECQALAKEARKFEHRAMFERMAETWQQIRRSLESSDPPRFSRH